LPGLGQFEWNASPMGLLGWPDRSRGWWRLSFITSPTFSPTSTICWSTPKITANTWKFCNNFLSDSARIKDQLSKILLWSSGGQLLGVVTGKRNTWEKPQQQKNFAAS
jgi:hypothetical protein